MKNQLGIGVLDQIKSLLRKNYDIVELDHPYNQVMRIIPIDTDVDFFFELGEQDNGNFYPVKFKPNDREHVRTTDGRMSKGDMLKSLESWLSIIREYANYDLDPIQGFFQKEYFEKLRINDPSADVEPFDDDKIRMIDGTISNIRLLVAAKKETATERETFELQDVEKECDILDQNLGRWSKNRVLNFVAKICAKLKKINFKLGNEVYSEATKAIAKQIVETASAKAGHVIDVIGQIVT